MQRPCCCTAFRRPDQEAGTKTRQKLLLPAVMILTVLSVPHVDQASKARRLVKASRTSFAALDAALAELTHLQAAVERLQQQIAADEALLSQALNLLRQALPRVAHLHQDNLQLQARLAAMAPAECILQNYQHNTGAG